MTPIQFGAPDPVRVRHAWRRGKDTYEPDRQIAAEMTEIASWIPVAVEAATDFVHRSVRLAVQSGMDQVLDIGTGIPMRPYLHETVAALNPGVRIVHVPDGALAGTYCRALLQGHDGAAVIDGGVGDPWALLLKASEHLDIYRPIAVVLDGALDHLSDTEKAAELVAEIRAVLAVDSCLILTHWTTDPDVLRDRVDATRTAFAAYNARITPSLVPRSVSDIELILRGWALPGPGLAPVTRVGGPVANSEPALPILAAVAVPLAEAIDFGERSSGGGDR